MHPRKQAGAAAIFAFIFVFISAANSFCADAPDFKNDISAGPLEASGVQPSGEPSPEDPAVTLEDDKQKKRMKDSRPRTRSVDEEGYDDGPMGQPF